MHRKIGLTVPVAAALSSIIAIHANAQQTWAGSDSPTLAWLAAASSQYTVCHVSDHEGDVEFARTWLDPAEQLARDKYSVTELRNSPSGGRVHINVFLYPEPTSKANLRRAPFECCYDAAGKQLDDGESGGYGPSTT